VSILHRRRVWLGPRVWLAALVLSGLVVTSSVAGGEVSGDRESVALSVRISSLTPVLYQGIDHSGCGAVSGLTSASYDNATGATTFGATARAPNCNSTFGRTAGAAYQLELSTPLNASSGSVRIQVNWSMNVAVSAAFHAGTCIPNIRHRTPSCSQLVESDVSTFLWIQDETNGSLIVAPGSHWNLSLIHDTHSKCYAPGHSPCPAEHIGALGNASFRGIVSLWANATLVATHQYELEIYLEAGAWAGFSTYATKPVAILSGGHATASVRLGSPGNWTTLDSVWIH
jgi:hypothetical protein